MQGRYFYPFIFQKKVEKMKKKGVATISFIVMVVAMYIGGSILDVIISDNVNYDVVSDESITISGVPEVITTDNNNVVSGTLTITNSTDYTLIVNTDYTVLDYDVGTINITSYDNTTYGDDLFLNYQYKGSQYMDNSIARTISPYIPVMILLALLGVVGLGAMK